MLHEKSKKITALLLSLAMSIIYHGTVSAASEPSIQCVQTEKALPILSVDSVEGTLQGGKSDLILRDKKSATISSAASSQTNKVTVDTMFDTQNSTNINAVTVNFAAKTSSAGTIVLSVYNLSTHQYDQKASFAATTDYNDYSYSFSGTDLSSYMNNTTIKIRLEMQNSSAFTEYLDYESINVRYESNNTTDMVKVYNASNSVVETGNAGTSSPANMKDPDGTYYSVASSSNKVSWYTKFQIDEAAEDIKAIKVSYSGKCSVKTNNLWLSFYRYDTGNWEVVTTINGLTTSTDKTFLLSDPNLIQSYVSRFGEIKVRVYNSATQSFTRDTDYLNVALYASSKNSVKTYHPESYLAEYGTVSSGNNDSLAHEDSSLLTLVSNESNKVALQSNFKIDIPGKNICQITATMRTSTNAATNNQYFSLYNYKTNSFTVVETQKSDYSDKVFKVTISDPQELDKYISDDGNLILRIYNSASNAFQRNVDLVELDVEYGQTEGFEIAQVTDIHEPVGSDNFKAIINELNTKVHPDFTVVTGDVSSHGIASEFDLYKSDISALNCPYYTLTGNHDVRWATSNGKNDFKEKIGPLYQSFTYKGIHFVMLDTSVTWENEGRIDKEQLEWLKNDLSSIPEGMPVMVFGHDQFKIDNDITGRYELLKVLKDYNVVAYMAGHLHYYYDIVVEGIPMNSVACTKDTSDIEYVTIRFTPNKYYIYKRTASNGASVLWKSGLLNNTEKAEVKIESINVLDNGNVETIVSMPQTPNGIESVRARIDNYYGPYTTLVKSGGKWVGEIDVSAYTPALVPGKHFVGVEVVDSNSGSWHNFKEYETASDSARTKWTFQTGGMIQSSPTYSNSKVYAGSEDGKVYCIDAVTGSKVWDYQTGDSVISKPVVTTIGNTDAVIVGSNDKNLYALNAQTGALIWKYKTEGSVISDPVVDNGVVYFGSGDCNIYAVNVSNGTLKWKYKAQGLMRQQPSIVNGVLYATVRDKKLWYAINIADGTLHWQGNAATDDSMYVCGDVRPVIVNNKWWCIDAQNTRAGYLNLSTGKLDFTTDALTDVSSRGMATDGSLVFYCANKGRQIYAINAQTNKIVWQLDLRYQSQDTDKEKMLLDCGLIYEDGILYHVAEKGIITGINSSNGQILFSYDAAGLPERTFWSTPEVHNKTIYACGINGKIYCVDYLN